MIYIYIYICNLTTNITLREGTHVGIILAFNLISISELEFCKQIHYRKKPVWSPIMCANTTGVFSLPRLLAPHLTQVLLNYDVCDLLCILVSFCWCYHSSMQRNIRKIWVMYTTYRHINSEYTQTFYQYAMAFLTRTTTIHSQSVDRKKEQLATSVGRVTNSNREIY